MWSSSCHGLTIAFGQIRIVFVCGKRLVQTSTAIKRLRLLPNPIVCAEERRTAGEEERRRGGTQERRNAGTGFEPAIVR
jgi:hypothetical protein